MNFVEASSYSSALLRQAGSTQLNLIIINSLQGLLPEDKIQSHTEKIYYFVVNFNKDHFQGLGTNPFESHPDSYSGGDSTLEGIETLQKYIDTEVSLLEAGNSMAALKNQSNVEIINSGNLEKDLIYRANWAKTRLQPLMVPARTPEKVH